MRILFTSMAVAGLVCSANAAAQPVDADGTYRVAISYADLNMHSPEGVATFNARVKAQARRVCGAEKVLPLEEAGDIRKCGKQLTRAAGQQVQLAIAPTPASGTRFAGR